MFGNMFLTRNAAKVTIYLMNAQSKHFKTACARASSLGS